MSLSDSDQQRLTAALDQLETERRRREDEKVAAGEAVRVPLLPVIWREDEDIDAAIERLKAREIEKLRAAGETREVLFEPPDFSAIVTGVPRNGEFGKWKYETFRAYPDRYATTRTVIPRNEIDDTPAPVPLEWKRVQTQFSPPDERSCGIVVEGARAVAGNQLHVRDHEGRTWVTPLNGDPDVQARKLLREKFGKHQAFNQPIHYPPRYH
jgi:hypothetical protein